MPHSSRSALIITQTKTHQLITRQEVQPKGAAQPVGSDVIQEHTDLITHDKSFREQPAPLLTIISIANGPLLVKLPLLRKNHTKNAGF